MLEIEKFLPTLFGVPMAKLILLGVADDGMVMTFENLELIKARCVKLFAPFPTGM